MKRLLTLLVVCLGLLGGVKAQTATQTATQGSYMDTIYLTFQTREGDIWASSNSVILQLAFVPSFTSIYVDWGDGGISRVDLITNEDYVSHYMWLMPYELSGAYWAEERHTWPNRDGQMLVKVYGVSNIRSFLRGVYIDASTSQNVLFEQVDLIGCQVLEDLKIACHSSSAIKKGLDVRGLPTLKRLQCTLCQLTELDVSQNPELEYLEYSYNLLTELDVSQNPALNYFKCNYNQLTELDVSQNPGLKIFGCRYNQLTELDISQNTELTYVECDHNQLTELDVSKNTKLTGLYYGYNCLTSLDLTKNTEMKFRSADQAEGNRLLVIMENEDATFDLSTLPNFDVERASHWNGGTVSGNTLTFHQDTVTYNYDTRNRLNYRYHTFTIIRKITTAMPVITPGSGAVEVGTTVTISCATDNAVIHYTTDGTAPTEESAVYSEPIVINTAMTIKAMAVCENYVNSAVSEASYTIMPEVAMPVIMPGSGAVEAGSTVTISCATNNAVIHYTTDGSMPTEESTVYSEPIVINTAMTIKAIGVCEGYVNSAVAEASYTIMPEVAMPVMTPGSGAVEAGSTVTISCATDNAVIHYTTDGTAPTAESAVYSEPIVINTAMTIKAIGVCAGYVNSEVAEASYTIKPVDPIEPEKPDTVAKPVFTPNGGEVERGSSVTIHCDTANATIHYTLDGTAPTAQSTVYTAPIVINEAMTIKAIAMRENYVNSEVATAIFTIKSVDPVVPDTVEMPVFTPKGGEVERGATVAITCVTENATIYYTIDGSTPTEQSTRFTTPIVINEAMTLKAMAVRENYVNSPVATATFTIATVANEAGQAVSLMVYAQDRTICLSEAAGEVSVYTVDGRRVFCGKAVRIPVAVGGIYIVRVAGRSYKLPVR